MVNTSSTLLVAAVLISATSTLAAPKALLTSDASLQQREFDEEFDAREPQLGFLVKAAAKIGSKVLPKVFSKLGRKAASHAASSAIDNRRQRRQRRELVPLDEESLFVREPEFEAEEVIREYLDLETRGKKKRRHRKKKHHKKPAMASTQAEPPAPAPDMAGADVPPSPDMGARSLDSMAYFDELIGRDFEVDELD